MTAVVDMVRTYNNEGYIWGRYVKDEPDPKKDIPNTRSFTLLVNGEVKGLAETLAGALDNVSLELTPGSELAVHGPSGASDDTAEIRIKVPVSALGSGGVAFLIRHLHETGNPTHLANWSEFHGEDAIVPEGLKDREPVPA